MTARPLTDADRVALEHLTRAWQRPPPCFNPNALCRDLQARGLIEVAGKPGAWLIRLTELGQARRDAAGEA